MNGVSGNKHLSALNRWYWFGSLLALVYGYKHVFDPHSIASSWGRSHWQHEETVDFVRLLGVWIIFQSIVAACIARCIKNVEYRYYLTIAHAFKNFAAFWLRVYMWSSGRYDPITTGFMVSTFADLLFSFGYGYFMAFPEKSKAE
jgi:hypothetical protein